MTRMRDLRMSRNPGTVRGVKIPEEVPSSEATRAPGKLFDRVYRGETIILTRYGRPYVILSPPPQHAEIEAAKKPKA